MYFSIELKIVFYFYEESVNEMGTQTYSYSKKIYIYLYMRCVYTSFIFFLITDVIFMKLVFIYCNLYMFC